MEDLGLPLSSVGAMAGGELEPEGQELEPMFPRCPLAAALGPDLG